MPSREPAGLPCLGVVAASSLLLLALSGCGGDGSGFQLPPTTGTLQVTTTTSGDDPDPDGYTVQLDGGEPQPIGVAATLERSELEPRDDHTLRLDGLAPNCSVAENPRTVQITAGQTTTSTFAVVCTATSGGVVITTVTTGAAPDPDGYGVVLDGVDQGVIAASGQLSLTGLALGSHVVGLSGLAGNCSLEGDNLRAVTVAPGSSAAVDYAITCSAPPANAGSLRVITVTTGDNPDADGYRFSLDRGENQPIPANATATIPNLAAGAHRVQLSGVSDNCQIQGTSSRIANVPGGGSTDVTFNVTCSRAVGSIRVTVSTSGSPADPNGYQITLDGGAGQHVDTDGSLRISDVPVGSHAVALGDIATGCTVTGGSSRQVEVRTGGTAEVRFTVTCSATSGGSGSILVTTETLGSDLDPDGYTVLVDDSQLGIVQPTDQVAIHDIAVGTHVVQLSGVADNCQITGTSRRGVTVADGQTSSVNYKITCGPPPSETGSLRVTTTTSGEDQDNNGYDVAVDDGSTRHIGTSDAVTVTDLAPGQHKVELSGLADNCTVQGENPRTVTVTANTIESTSFEISCAATPPPTGSVEVTVTTSGENPDPDGYTVTFNGVDKAVNDGNPASYPDVAPGSYQASLAGEADNCSVQGDNPQPVVVTAGQQTSVHFNVACSAPATNTSPSAENDSYTINAGTQLRAPAPGAPGLLENDSDKDGDNLSTVPEAKSTQEQGNVVIGDDGSFDYTPAESFTGPDSFQYTVTDGRGGEGTGVATIQVNSVE
ncbi:MAG: Ig-like domain-containing protein [Gemmatimonadales bacterium]